MILTFCRWCETTALAGLVRDSAWGLPAMLTVHLLGLALLSGASSLVDVRLLGVRFGDVSARALADGLGGWWRAGLAVVGISGALLFITEAQRCYDTPPFWAKLTFLAAALIWTATVRRWALDSGEDGGLQRVAGGVSIGLWIATAILGRGVGFW